MNTNKKKKSFIEIQDEVLKVLQNIYDPEIPVSIYELGLIYETKVNPDNSVYIQMTLTTPNCPVAESLPNEIKTKVEAIPEVKNVELNLTFDPPWTQDNMSEAAKLELGFL